MYGSRYRTDTTRCMYALGHNRVAIYTTTPLQFMEKSSSYVNAATIPIGYGIGWIPRMIWIERMILSRTLWAWAVLLLTKYTLSLSLNPALRWNPSQNQNLNLNLTRSWTRSQNLSLLKSKPRDRYWVQLTRIKYHRIIPQPWLTL